MWAILATLAGTALAMWALYWAFGQDFPDKEDDDDAF